MISEVSMCGTELVPGTFSLPYSSQKAMALHDNTFLMYLA